MTREAVRAVSTYGLSGKCKLTYQPGEACTVETFRLMISFKTRKPQSIKLMFFFSLEVTAF